MSAPLTLRDYRELIHLDDPLPEGIMRGAGQDPLALPTIAEVFPDTTYQSAKQTALWRGDITNEVGF